MAEIICGRRENKNSSAWESGATRHTIHVTAKVQGVKERILGVCGGGQFAVLEHL